MPCNLSLCASRGASGASQTPRTIPRAEFRAAVESGARRTTAATIYTNTTTIDTNALESQGGGFLSCLQVYYYYFFSLCKVLGLRALYLHPKLILSKTESATRWEKKRRDLGVHKHKNTTYCKTKNNGIPDGFWSRWAKEPGHAEHNVCPNTFHLYRPTRLTPLLTLNVLELRFFFLRFPRSFSFSFLPGSMLKLVLPEHC